MHKARTAGTLAVRAHRAFDPGLPRRRRRLADAGARGGPAPAGAGRPARHHRHAARRRGRRVRTRGRPDALDRPPGRGRRPSSAMRTRTTSSPCLPTPTSCPGACPSSTACGTTRGSAFRSEWRRWPRGFRPAGYRTGAFVSAFTLESRFGLDRGFDVYDDRFADGAEADAFVLARAPRRGDGGRGARLDRRQATAGRRSPGSISTIRTRRTGRRSRTRRASPTTPISATWRRRMRRSRSSSRRCSRPADAPTLVVLTADHGESPGRARREDPRRLCLRVHAARPAGLVRARRPAGAPGRRDGRPRGHRAHHPRRAGGGGAGRHWPAGACCPSSPAPATSRA